MTSRMTIAFVALLLAGCAAKESTTSTATHETHGDPGADRYKVAIDGDDPRSGRDDAPVTIVVFTDVQINCPWCVKQLAAFRAIQEKYPAELRIVYKVMSLTARWTLAADAAYAAAAQHKFLRFVEVESTATQPEDGRASYTREWIDEHARRAELDMDRFDTDITTIGPKRREAVAAQAKKMSITAFPTWFINGTFIGGYRDEAFVDRAVRDALDDARAFARDHGVAAGELYGAMMRDAWERTPAAPEPTEKIATPPALPALDPAVTYSIDVADDPSTGPADARVTVVLAYDYRCSSCRAMFGKRIPALAGHVPDGSFRVVYKPFANDDKRKGLWVAACAAKLQRKFSELDPFLWDVATGVLEKTCDSACANERFVRTGFDLARFDRDGPSCVKIVESQTKYLRDLGVREVLAVFVNGLYVSSLDDDSIDKLVDSADERARQRIAEGTPAKDYYQTWVVEKGQKPVVP